MSFTKHLILPVIILCAAALWASPLYATTYYVNGSVGASGDGLTPGTAFKTIQEGLTAAAASGDSVFVADGTYSGTSNVELYFSGKSINLRSQNGATNCIIDGGSVSRAFYLYDTGETNSAVIDGFTVQNGYASVTSIYGGGILLSGSSPTVKNCVVKNCYAGSHGGGIYCRYGADAVIENCTFTNNTAGLVGGGVRCYSSNATIRNCTITNNTSEGYGGYGGGGVGLTLSNATIVNCVVTGNIASVNDGGGFLIEDASPTITDCLIANNQGTDWGGGIVCYQETGTCSPTFNNCTIANNTTGGTGGGIMVYYGTATLNNTIIWGNSAPTTGNQIGTYSALYGTVNLNYSDYADNTLDPNNIYGTIFPDANCITSNPLFVGASNYHLQAGSPCINDGNNSYISGVTTDLDGNPRIANLVVDMGPYEVPGGPVAPVVTVTTPASPASSPVTITYDLMDGNGDPCTVTFEYSPVGDSNWYMCTPAAGTNPQTNVAPGTGHTFLWDAETDLPGGWTEVEVRVTANDGITGTGSDTTNPFAVDIPIPLQPPTNLSGVGISATQIEWTWDPPSSGGTPDGYQVEDDTGTVISIVTDTSYIDTISGENTPATRQVRSAVFGTTSLSVEPAVTGGFTWPWTSTGRRMQMLYLASELSSQSGSIKKIYWKLNTDTPGYSYTNVIVKLGHTTVSALGTNFAANYTNGDDTVVWNTPLYSIPAATGGAWIEIPITGTFFYNGVDNLVFEVNLESGTGDCSWADNNTYVGTSLYAAPGGSTGTVWNVKFLIKFDMDIVTDTSAGVEGPETAYSLVHDATVDDFGLALTATPGEVEVTVTPPNNPSVGSTGVKIERADDDLFSVNLTTVQAATSNYTFIDTVTVGATYWYRITFQNADAIASATSGGESIYVPPEINTPTVVINSPTGGVWSGDITVWYTLSDPQGDTCSAVVEFTTGTGWYPCTQNGGDNIASLVSTAGGTSHNFVWNSVTDSVGISGMEQVDFRITPDDGGGGTADTVTFSVNNLGSNEPPLADITAPAGGTLSGNIQIDFNLSDLNADTCGATLEYSYDELTWFVCTVTSGTNPATPLTSSGGTGDPHSMTWNSITDGVGMLTGEIVHIMVTPWDVGGEGTSDTVTVTVDNVPQQPPSVLITSPTAGTTHSGDVTIQYTLTDINDDDCTIVVEYSTNGGGSWAVCTEGTGGDGLSSLAADATGIDHVFVWDSVADNVGTSASQPVLITITPSDAAAGTADTSDQFNVDNTTSPFPDADFMADTTTGPASLTVNFTDTSTGNRDSWLWDFGDGGTSTEQHPTHIYYLVGTYDVTLTIGSPLYGEDSETKVGYITVTDPPGGMTAEFVGTPVTGSATLHVDFQDLSVGDINRWSWDFGDGAVTLDRNPSHDYTATGTYTVILSVSGPGGSDTETKVGYITVTGGAAIVPQSKKKSGCSCAVDTGPVPSGDLLGYFFPAILIVCAYLALRRRTETP